jgi:hypothetical protein
MLYSDAPEPALAIVICWLMAISGVLCDAWSRGARGLGWWLAASLLGGPLAALAWLLCRPTPGVAPIAASAEGAARLPTRRLEEQSAPTTPAHGHFYLLVREGDARDVQRGRALPIQGSLTVRRAAEGERVPAGTLALHDEAASRGLHCRVYVDGAQATLEDLSSNGTMVDHTHVHRRAVGLVSGGHIQIGRTILVLLDRRRLSTTKLS